MPAIWEQDPWLMPQSYGCLPEVAISACLMGERVRYDGADQSLSTTKMLASQLQLVALCPEVAVGMPVPRPPIQLVEIDRQWVARGREDRTIDMTAALGQYRQQCADRLKESLCGYIFKSKSPSCGLNSTPLFNPQGEQIGIGSGLQAEYFQRRLPWLAFIDETRLQTARQCRQFIWRCRLAYDLRLGCQQQGLAAIHHHYAPLIARLPATRQQQLTDAVQHNDEINYRCGLLNALEQLITSE